MEDNYQEVTVNILGTEYHLRTDLDKKYLVSLSEYINREMCTISENSSDLLTSKIAVLAALRITEELFEARRQTDQLREKIETSIKETHSMLQKSFV